MVEGLPSIKFSTGTCKGCIVGKKEERKYEKGKAIRVVHVMELIHSDIIGHIPTPSYVKSRYVLTFIDDFSRYCWVYFLKQKFEVYDIFKVFKGLVENLSGKKIKVLRDDNGKEYINKNLHHICEENGIQMQHSVPYTPQQNGVVECKNKALKDMATCMLEDKYLYPKIWYVDINCAEYVQNIFTQKKLE